MNLRLLILLLMPPLHVILANPSDAFSPGEPRAHFEPEETTLEKRGSVKIGTQYMISTSSQEASEAGTQILEQGGSAIDAAIAAQLVLGLVEPQSSGLGGGAFLLHWQKDKKELRGFDGRETAPNLAKSDSFLIDGKPIPFSQAMRSGLSVGTPGIIRLLWETHKIYGKLSWERLFDPAIQLANDGFPISKRLHLLLVSVGPNVFDEKARSYFFDKNGLPYPSGYILKNPEYVLTLKKIAKFGSEGFYTGTISDQIINAVGTARTIKGSLTTEDLAEYNIEIRDPICTKYRNYKVCSMPPPSSGGIFLKQTLEILGNFDLGTGVKESLNVEALHLIAEAEKLAYSDRNQYVADPKFVEIPAFLTDSNYISTRQKLIAEKKAMPSPKPGNPIQKNYSNFGQDSTKESNGTTQISIIDKYGNAVSMTSTIEGVFGSGLMAAGFLLNNELTDFSFSPIDEHGKPIANKIEAGKRPRSSMSPTLIFDMQNNLVGVLGSPGGGRILFYVLKALIALMDWKLNPYEAAALVNFGSTGGAFEIEYSWHTVPLGVKLKTYGHTLKTDLMNSGLNILSIKEGLIEGGSDPRRGGSALGK